MTDVLLYGYVRNVLWGAALTGTGFVYVDKIGSLD